MASNYIRSLSPGQDFRGIVLVPEFEIAQAAEIAPLGQDPASIGAHVFGLGDYPDSWQIQPVSVQTSSDAWIAMRQGGSVDAAGFMKQIEARVIDFEERATKFPGQLRSAQSMFWVLEFILPARIVKESEEPHDVHACSRDLGKVESVLLDTTPM